MKYILKFVNFIAGKTIALNVNVFISGCGIFLLVIIWN